MCQYFYDDFPTFMNCSMLLLHVRTITLWNRWKSFHSP